MPIPGGNEFAWSYDYNDPLPSRLQAYPWKLDFFCFDGFFAKGHSRKGHPRAAIPAFGELPVKERFVIVSIAPLNKSPAE